MISGGSGLGPDAATTHPHEWRRRFNSASLQRVTQSRILALPVTRGARRAFYRHKRWQGVRVGWRTTARRPAAVRGRTGSG